MSCKRIDAQLRQNEGACCCTFLTVAHPVNVSVVLQQTSIVLSSCVKCLYRQLRPLRSLLSAVQETARRTKAIRVCSRASPQLNQQTSCSSLRR